MPIIETAGLTDLNSDCLPFAQNLMHVPIKISTGKTLWEMSEQFSEKSKRRKHMEFFGRALVGTIAMSAISEPCWGVGTWKIIFLIIKTWPSWTGEHIQAINQSIIIIYLKPNKEKS